MLISKFRIGHLLLQGSGWSVKVADNLQNGNSVYDSRSYRVDLNRWKL